MEKEFNPLDIVQANIHSDDGDLASIDWSEILLLPTDEELELALKN